LMLAEVLSVQPDPRLIEYCIKPQAKMAFLRFDRGNKCSAIPAKAFIVGIFGYYIPCVWHYYLCPGGIVESRIVPTLLFPGVFFIKGKGPFSGQRNGRWLNHRNWLT